MTPYNNTCGPASSRRAATLLAFLVIFASSLASAAPHPLKIAGADQTKVGIYIEDLRTGEVLADYNSDEALVPASVTKSLTSATAYCTFSPRGRFTTPVMVNGKVRKGVLDGDVIISTIGDPTVESAHFPDNKGFADSIVAALKRRDIHEIKGNVILDESNFVDSSIPAGWLKEDVLVPYGAGLYASNFRDNRMVLSLPSKATSPHTPGVRVNMTGGKGAARISRSPNSNVFNVSGNVKRRGFSSTVANPAPGSAMLAEVVRAIEHAGISIGSSSRHPDTLEGDVIYLHTSPTVEDILRSLMFRSDNMMAEGMLRSLAQGRSRMDALEAERNFWLEKGFDVSKLNIEDGSGLSRNDRITPRFMADVYKWMYHTDMAGGYANLFPRAGQDGTMRNFLKGSPLEGRLAMKTGSMKGVQCFGGYMLDNDGRPTHAVVVFVNNFRCGRDALKKEIGRFLVSKLSPADE